MGKDNEVIPILLEIHCNIADPKILDCTYNSGKMWKNLPFVPHRMDINSQLELDTELDKIYIYDIKTSTRGWNDTEKKDDSKIAQILLYKEYFSKQFFQKLMEFELITSGK